MPPPPPPPACGVTSDRGDGAAGVMPSANVPIAQPAREIAVAITTTVVTNRIITCAPPPGPRRPAWPADERDGIVVSSLNAMRPCEPVGQSPWPTDSPTARPFVVARQRVICRWNSFPPPRATCTRHGTAISLVCERREPSKFVRWFGARSGDQGQGATRRAERGSPAVPLLGTVVHPAGMSEQGAWRRGQPPDRRGDWCRRWPASK